STFLPVKPCASRTIRRLSVKMAESRNVLYAAIGCSPWTSRGPMSCGIGHSATKVHAAMEEMAEVKAVPIWWRGGTRGAGASAGDTRSERPDGRGSPRMNHGSRGGAHTESD